MLTFMNIHSFKSIFVYFFPLNGQNIRSALLLLFVCFITVSVSMRWILFMKKSHPSRYLRYFFCKAKLNPLKEKRHAFIRIYDMSSNNRRWNSSCETLFPFHLKKLQSACILYTFWNKIRNYRESFSNRLGKYIL